MPRRPTEDSLKIRALARAHGKTERWARKQRQIGSDVWREFCDGQKIDGAALDLAEKEQRQGARSIDQDTDLEKSERVCVAAWSAWEGMDKLLTASLHDPDKQDVIPSLARAVRESRKQWEDATKHREALLRAEGLWIPVERVMAIRTHLKPLGAVIDKLEVSIAGRLSPENRHEFYQAFESAMPEWNAGVRKMDDYVRSLLPC